MLVIIFLLIILVFIFLMLGIWSLIKEDQKQRSKPFGANKPGLTEDQNVNLLSHETLRRLKRIMIEIDDQRGNN